MVSAKRAVIKRAISANQRTLDGDGGARVASALERGESSTSTPTGEAMRGAIREAIGLSGRQFERSSEESDH